MANDEHLNVLRQGAETWNQWRAETADTVMSLDRSYLVVDEPERPNLANADLRGADLRRCNLELADLRGVNLEGAQLGMANLMYANFEEASLKGATFAFTNLTGTNLKAADFIEAKLLRAIFADVCLTETKHLDSCSHHGPSYVDHATLARSKGVPEGFWRGCGVPDTLIDYMPSLTGDAIQFYSCFISYSSKDEDFANRLHADLQNTGVRCWFAPQDLPIGEKILDGLDKAIRLRDKVVLILSEDSIASGWVEDEVTTAFEEERRRNETVLFPIRLDDAVIRTNQAWASKLRARNIGDFSKWKDHDVYKASFQRILRDLRIRRLETA
ncbi:MAG: toll/interleukin-1 receptor domain-containing protein [Cyanobacteria bacterium P01_F01_bin.33]